MTIDELTRFLDSLPTRPQLLALGEPTHWEDGFLHARNAMFRLLVESEGYRSIAIESDCLAGLVVDAFVTGGPGSLDEVMAAGFSHGFGASSANRELVAWMRQENEGREETDRLRFDGFDPPMEMEGAASPRASLLVVDGYLGAGQADLIERLAGADARWSDPAAMWDAGKSVGDTDDARTLRRLADDLAEDLTARLGGGPAPERVRLHARTATGLLRYHAVMAEESPSRYERLGAERDALMAVNLRAIAEREAPTLVFAHNLHLQKVGSTSAGAITAATLGDAYAFVATAVGSAASFGLGAPEPDTLEGILATHEALLTAADVRAALRGHQIVPRTVPDQRYFPLDPEHLGGADGVLILPNL